LLGVQAMVERLTESGSRFPGEEQIDVFSALRSYTLNSAYAGFNDHDRGSLAVRKQADLTFLGADPTKVDASEIGAIPVLRTVTGGEVVYDVAG